MIGSFHATTVVLLLLFAITCPCLVLGAATAYVSKAGQPNTTLLLPALLNPQIHNIVLLSDYPVGTDLDSYQATPLPINRNITISGPADQWPIIDLQAKAGLLELCATCTFTFQHLMIANETAKGRTSGISILRGRTGGRVDATNTYGLHVACPPTASSLQIISTTQCSPLFPGLDRPQVASATNATFRGKTYTDCLDVEDMTADIPLTLVTGGVYMGGYAIRRRNSIRLCQMTITAACLAVNTPEQCLAQLMDAGGGGGGPSQGSNLTVVAAPVAVVGAVSLAAVVALLVFKHRRRRKQRQYAEQQLLPYTLHKQAAAASGNDAGGLHDQDGSSTRDPPTPAQSISQPSSQTPSSSRTPLQHHLQRPSSGQEPLLHSSQHSSLPLGSTTASSRRMSWEQTWSQTAPAMQWAEDNTTIELGVLLGAGSFARVFKARWAGLDVAVKVIQHDSSSSAAVALEVQLMMRLNHPNIVRAYHCVNKQLPQHDFGGAGGDGGGSGGRRTLSDPSTAVAGLAHTVHGGKQTTQGLEVVEHALGCGAGPDASGSLPQQQTQTLRMAGSLGAAAAAQIGKQGPDQPVLSVIVPMPRLPSDIPPTPLGLTPGMHIGSSVTLPTDTNTSAMGTFVLSGTFSGPRTLSGSVARRRDSGSSSEAAPPALYIRKGDHQSSSAVIPQTLDLNPEQQQQQQRAAIETLSPVSSSSSGSVRRVSFGALPGPRTGALLPTIYSASGTASGGTASSSGPGTAAAVADEHDASGQRHVGSLERSISRANSNSPLAAAGRSGALFSPTAAATSVPPPAAAGTLPSVPSLPAAQLSRLANESKALSSSSSPSGLGSATAPVWSIISTQPETEGQDIGSPSAAAAADMLLQPGSDEPTVACETWLVTELCDRGTLARVAADWKPAKSDRDMLQLLTLLLDVARGLKLLHAKNIIHADLNAHNVMVSSSPTAPYGLVAKIADLGLSRIIKQQVGTLTHQPPELLRDGRSSPAVDIYSYGIMMWELYTGQAAFARMRYGQIYHQVVINNARPPVPPDMCDDYHLLMASCWSSAPEERPSVDMMLHCLELMIQDRQ